MRDYRSGGGLAAILYTLGKARQVGIRKLYNALRSNNACKTCALGMGGQRGGMVNELGRFPEVCKKSVQAMAADMQGAITSSFWDEHPLDRLRTLSPYQLEHSGRLARPVIHRRGGSGYQETTWDAAIDRIAEVLRAARPAETFWYFSGRSSNEAGFLLQLLARIYGTNNVNNCSYYCHQASGVGLSSSVGSGTATIVLEDLDRADCVFLMGGNPPSNHPRLMTSLTHLRRRGGEVIVVNPMVETGLVRFRVPSDPKSLIFGTQIASLYVQPHVGGDLALLSGIAKRIVELDAHDENFLTDCCDGWPELAAALAGLQWSNIEQKSGVERSQINEVARRYAAAENAVFAWTMGITHHAHGVNNVQAIANVALLRAMVGRPGCGLLPIRGHSNVQGMGTVGVTPALKQAVFDNLQDHFGVKLPTEPGLDTLACMEGAYEGRLKVGFCLGGNLYGSNPDSEFAAAALESLDLIVYLSTTLNTGHTHGLARETIILPVLARDEEHQPTTQESMFNFVRLSDGGPRRHAGTKSEVEVISKIAAAVLGSSGPIDWQAMANHDRIREAIGRIVPGMDKVAEISQSRDEFQIRGRTFHEPRFPTPTGRAQLHAHTLPDAPGGEDTLRLMTIRSEGQFNTVVYEEEDIHRGQDRRDVILLHPGDIGRLGLEANKRVTVKSDTGSMPNILVRPFEQIKPGNAVMYYPEANKLVPRVVDPKSRTPAFKGIPITVEVPAPVATPV